MTLIVYAVYLLLTAFVEAESEDGFIRVNSRLFHINKIRVGTKGNAGSADATLFEVHSRSLQESCILQCTSGMESHANALNYNKASGECECLHVNHEFADFTVDSAWDYYELDREEKKGEQLNLCNGQVETATVTHCEHGLECLDGYEYVSGTHSCYRIDDDVPPVSLTDAQTSCAADETSLLKLETTTEADIVTARLAAIEWDDFVLWLNDDGCYMSIQSEYINKWVHFSLTWQSATGLVKLYLDGKLEGQEGVPIGTTIPTGGTFLLGQDQDSLLGGFELYDSFNGQVRNFHLFATALSDSVVQAIYLGDDVRCGDVVGCGPTDFTLVGENIQNDVPNGKPRYWLNSVASSDEVWQWQDTCENISHYTDLPGPVTGSGLTVAHDLMLQGRRPLDDMNYICEQNLC